MNEIAIKVENLNKIYKLYEKPIDRLKESLSFSKKTYGKPIYALNNVSFQVEKGDSVGIVGKNGSGKSTLLKIITGVLTQSGGCIAVNGKISALLELGAGFNNEYTGIENIYLNGTMMGFTKEEINNKIDSIMEFADIGEFIYQPVKTYSSGMFARLAFAVSINVEPDILIIDEALAVGDTRFQVKCIDKMKELKENGTTILFVSHATEQIKRFCSKAIWLKDGKVELQGEASYVVDMYENHMKFGENSKNEFSQCNNETVSDEKSLVLPEDKNIMARITDIKLNKSSFQTFDKFEVEVSYEIYEDEIDGFILGVAIYTADRKGYIFGPNTYLDKKTIPNKYGKHKVLYTIQRLTLINGIYDIDVGIFNNEGIVNFDYKTGNLKFSVTNNYFSEGTFFMDHEWTIEK